MEQPHCVDAFRGPGGHAPVVSSPCYLAVLEQGSTMVKANLE